MSVRILEEQVIAALRLFEEAADDLVDGETQEVVRATVCEGVEAFDLQSPDSRLLMLRGILTMEILRGYWSMARWWLEKYELENRREATLSMIFVLLGSASYMGGGLHELERYVEACYRYPQIVSDMADDMQASEYYIVVARVVEAAWATRTCEIEGQAVPVGDEPESEEFAVRIASIMFSMQQRITEVEARFSQES